MENIFPRYAIFGGSFNPVHIGHLLLADELLFVLGYDRVILVPAFQSPLKSASEGASPFDRMDMLAASIAGDPRLTIDDCELQREGVSFTIDTIKDIIARYSPMEKPGLLIGDDLVSAFNEWKSPEEIVSLADIIIARRLTGQTAAFPYPHKTLSNDIINLSSSEILEKIGRAGAWRYYVPSGARQIIEDRGLYRPGSSPASAAFKNGNSSRTSNGRGSQPKRENEGLLEKIANIENAARASLDFEKFIHSRNTALLSWDLCRRFGLESQKGYLAGIAHDMCKYVNEKELIRLAHEDGKSLSKLEQKKPSLLHARAAAVILQKSFGISDKDILDAIRYHTTGVEDMKDLAKVVYIADKIEVSRTGVDPALREMSKKSDLDTLFSAVLNNTVSYLRSRHLDLSYGTRKLLAAMSKRNGNAKD